MRDKAVYVAAAVLTAFVFYLVWPVVFGHSSSTFARFFALVVASFFAYVIFRSCGFWRELVTQMGGERESDRR